MTVKLYAFCFTSRTSVACSSLVRSRFGILEMGSRSLRAALHHGFLEQTVARVTVTTLLQRGYSGQRNVRECTGET